MRRPAAIRPRRRSLVPLIPVLVLIVMAVYLGQLSRTVADPDQLQLLAGLCAGGAIGVLLLTMLRRR